jgi:hypothetical protein
MGAHRLPQGVSCTTKLGGLFKRAPGLIIANVLLQEAPSEPRRKSEAKEEARAEAAPSTPYLPQRLKDDAIPFEKVSAIGISNCRPMNAACTTATSGLDIQHLE